MDRVSTVKWAGLCAHADMGKRMDFAVLWTYTVHADICPVLVRCVPVTMDRWEVASNSRTTMGESTMMGRSTSCPVHERCSFTSRNLGL